MKLIDPYIQEHYAEYDDRVKVFLSRVIEDCKAQHEKLSNYFYVCLDLLSNQLKIYFLSLDAIDLDKKVSTQDDYKRAAKSPCISVMNKAHQEILTILSKLSLSPYDKVKLEKLKNIDDSESAQELLENLIK